jgi:septal ring factor EnvC (AmiA/AmiB activator)
MPAKILLTLICALMATTVMAADTPLTDQQKIIALEQKIAKLQKNQKTELSQLEQKNATINALKRQVDKLTAHQQLENDILGLSEKIDNIDSQHEAIFNISSILIGAMALFGLGGATFTIYEVKSKDKELRKIVDEFNKERENVLEDFETKGKKLMKQFGAHESKLENALEDFDIESKKLVKQFDHSERLIRLTQMLNVRDFDNETFYSDLTQLAQAPTPMMSNLMTLIVETHQTEFDNDVLELAWEIIAKA